MSGNTIRVNGASCGPTNVVIRPCVTKDAALAPAYCAANALTMEIVRGVLDVVDTATTQIFQKSASKNPIAL